MDEQRLKKEWLQSEERQKKFSGWDFSYLNDRWYCEKTVWDYRKLVLTHLSKEMMLLDMGTGGGELLQTFHHPYRKTAVTEGYLPNYELLVNNLKAKGVTVQFVEKDGYLAFPDDSFDLVINSHESFSLKEVKRVLKKEGLFISQQVGDFNGVNLASRVLQGYKKESFSFHLATVKKELEKASFDIVQEDEAYLKQLFFDMSGLIYYLRTIKWEYPDFSVENNFEELLSLYEELLRHGCIFNMQHRFVFVAKNRK